MILPILAYGTPSLRKISDNFQKNDLNLKNIIADLEETMQQSDGIGLAAPQVGFNKRLFIINADPLSEEDENLKDWKKIFVNARITKKWGENWTYNEGCLSIPLLREDIIRPSKIKIEYFDENFNFFEEEYDGVLARIIQHEYDHLEGKLFTDYVSPLRKKLLKPRLRDISIGKVDIFYKMKFPLKK